MSDKIEEQIERVKSELAEPIPEAGEKKAETAPQKRGAKKVAKKAVKKSAKKAVKSSKKTNTDDNSVTLKDLAKEAKLTEQRARQKLRTAEVERDGRWSWPQGSGALKAARKALGLS